MSLLERLDELANRVADAERDHPDGIYLGLYRARIDAIGIAKKNLGAALDGAWPQIREVLVAADALMRDSADPDGCWSRLDVALRPFFPLPCACGHEDGDHLGGGDRECAAEGCECMEYDPGDPVRPEPRQ